MKKLLSLLFAMILCLGVLIGCDGEAEKESMRAEIESEIRAEIEAEERAKREKTYTFYSVILSCNKDVFMEKELYYSYDSFYSSYRQLYEYEDDDIVKITPETWFVNQLHPSNRKTPVLIAHIFNTGVIKSTYGNLLSTQTLPSLHVSDSSALTSPHGKGMLHHQRTSPASDTS